MVPMKPGNRPEGPGGGTGEVEWAEPHGRNTGTETLSSRDIEPETGVNEIQRIAGTGDAMLNPSRREAATRRAGCGSPARPDLLGAGEGNLPGLPERAGLVLPLPGASVNTEQNGP